VHAKNWHILRGSTRQQGVSHAEAFDAGLAQLVERYLAKV
jgi:hypothetical protein